MYVRYKQKYYINFSFMQHDSCVVLDTEMAQLINPKRIYYYADV